ncbi:phosphomannomutase [Propionivibrio dicarboxylicus]|uniref:Phosphomannomutase n=1 Tax=Propionivibrio dicarboxylicus TaxID=83767 RepID=A0A1G7VK23_9RHOO|nr:phosphomannomutase [Propionivibrio dicarboxylicus]SDG59908.1 phosphomannomutase [Propionivibrio dicarboxylicus]
MKMAMQYRIADLMETSGVRFGTSGARGLVAAMTAEVCHAYAVAFLQAVPAKAGRVALAIDLRPSSPAIASACVAAIEAAGLKADYCGAIPTPALALYAEAEGIPAIMVTGSHIPFDRNGIKFYSANGEITKDDEARIRDAIVTVPDSGVTAPLPAPNDAARRAYLQRYRDFFPSAFLAGKKVAVYEHSSVARDLLRELLEGFGAQVLSLGRTDAFVPIDTEAVSAEDVAQARRWAVANSFDAIVSTDGDADRPLIGDENGDWFRGDVTGILCAQYLGAGAVATTVNCNTAIDSCGAFSRVTRTRIGSPYVIEGIEQLLAADAGTVVGFEPNGGFLVGSPLTRSGRALAALKTRDAVLPMLSLLALAGENGQPLSALSSRLPARFTASDRLQAFSTARSRALIAELTASSAAIEDFLAGLAGKPVSIDETDGLRIRLDSDEIVHLRPSGNAPELRCYAEASDAARARHLVEECLKRVLAFGGTTAD